MILKEWNEKLQNLRKIIMQPDKIDDIKRMCLELHEMVHTSKMSGTQSPTFEDELWKNLDEQTARSAINEKGRTVLYGLWHSARIEDITMNILVAGQNQVFEEGNWQKRIKSPIKNTGNGLTGQEIFEFSQKIDISELQEYRMAVGRKTREIISSLKGTDLKKKMSKDSLQRIIDEEAVENIESANWLIDFWGKKNMAGILLMPVTRHHIVHINESLRAIKRSRKQPSTIIVQP